MTRADAGLQFAHLGALSGPRGVGGVPVSEREEEPECRVDSLDLGGVEPAGRITQSLGINDGGLLDEHTRLRA